MENSNIINENFQNLDSEKSSFFEQKVSSSNGKEDLCPRLRFLGFNDNWYPSKLKNLAAIYDGTHQTPQYQSYGIKFVSVEDILNLEKLANIFLKMILKEILK